MLAGRFDHMADQLWIGLDPSGQLLADEPLGQPTIDHREQLRLVGLALHTGQAMD